VQLESLLRIMVEKLRFKGNWSENAVSSLPESFCDMIDWLLFSGHWKCDVGTKIKRGVQFSPRKLGGTFFPYYSLNSNSRRLKKGFKALMNGHGKYISCFAKKIKNKNGICFLGWI